MPTVREIRMPIQTSSEPIPKKRKLVGSGPAGSQGTQNSSFTEVLEKLEKEAKETGGGHNVCRFTLCTNCFPIVTVNRQREGLTIGRAHLFPVSMRRRIP